MQAAVRGGLPGDPKVRQGFDALTEIYICITQALAQAPGIFFHRPILCPGDTQLPCRAVRAQHLVNKKAGLIQRNYLKVDVYAAVIAYGFQYTVLCPVICRHGKVFHILGCARLRTFRSLAAKALQSVGIGKTPLCQPVYQSVGYRHGTGRGQKHQNQYGGYDKF